MNKAVDDAVYRNFLNQKSDEFFHVIKHQNEYMVVSESMIKYLHDFDVYPLTKDYSHMIYDQIKLIAKDTNPLSHWEELRGMISVTDHDVPRFILEMNIPLEKFIRAELAASGIDNYGKSISFQKAEELWMK